MNSQDSHGVGGSRSLSPAGDDDHVVSRGDELALLAEVDGVVDSGVHVVNPGAVRAGLLVVQGDAAAEHLGLPRHLGVPAKTKIFVFHSKNILILRLERIN